MRRRLTRHVRAPSDAGRPYGVPRDDATRPGPRRRPAHDLGTPRRPVRGGGRRLPRRADRVRLPLGRGRDVPPRVRSFVWSDIPNDRHAALGRADRRDGRVPLAGRLPQRQHPRPAGPAGHLRARRPAGHPDRARRLDHRPRRPLRRPALQQPQRRRRRPPAAGSGSPTRPTASPPTTRAQAEPEIGATTSTGSTPTAPCHRVTDDFDQPNGLAFSLRREAALRRRLRRRRHMRVFDVADEGRSPAARCSPTCTAGTFDGFRLDSTGRIWTAPRTASTASTRTAR